MPPVRPLVEAGYSNCPGVTVPFPGPRWRPPGANRHSGAISRTTDTLLEMPTDVARPPVALHRRRVARPPREHAHRDSVLSVSMGLQLAEYCFQLGMSRRSCRLARIIFLSSPDASFEGT